MAYSSQIRAAVGAVRESLAGVGVGVQDRRFTQHGEHDPLPDAPLVLVACSGGRDSMALAAVARTVCASLGVRCGAVIIDHGLQAGSGRVARETADRCERLGLAPVTLRAVQVRESGTGVEAAARDARYRALAAAAREYDASAVLLAHTRDDQAETVLLGLLRSGGIDAIAGMPPTFDRDGVLFARPFLELGRADTTAICEQLRVTWWDDPTNGEAVEGPLDARYPLRSRIRHDLMPALARFMGADVSAVLARGARSARHDKEYLDAGAERALADVACFAGTADAVDGADGTDTAGVADAAEPAGADAVRAGERQERSAALLLDARKLGALHPAIRRRVIAHGLASVGVTGNQRQVEAVERLAVDWHGQGAVNLSGGYSANRQKHVIRVCQDGMHENRGCSGSD